jgi:hypothetical protein
MSRRLLALGFTAVALAACSSVDSTAPTARAPQQQASFDAGGIPHNGGGKGPKSEHPSPASCVVSSPLSGSARIGPLGGILDVGPHHVIVPPGALGKTVTLTGFVPAGNKLQIELGPEGLEFNRPALLILDTSGCSNLPATLYIDYVDQDGNLLQRIQAVFSAVLHIIVAPIEHFSIYAFDV